MTSDSRIALINVCKEIVGDGILTKSEIVGLAKWLNANPEVRTSWPGKPLVRLLKSVFADNKISKEESRKVGAALQSILRQWAKQEQQSEAVKVTVEVVDANESPDRSGPSSGDWRQDQATERQISYARVLGVTIPPNATKGQASDIISKGVQRRDVADATDVQRDEAKLLGVQVPKRATVAEASSIIRGAKPTWQQRQFFERADVPFPPDIGRNAMDVRIKQLESDPVIAQRIRAAIEAEQKANESAEQEMRLEDIENYGLKAVEEFERWEPITDDIGPYVIIYRSGKSLKVEVVEFEGAEIEAKPRGKSRVVLDCLFPKRVREDGEKWLEWEKEKRLVARRIEYVVLLDKVWKGQYIEEIDQYESLVDDFERRADSLVQK